MEFFNFYNKWSSLKPKLQTEITERDYNNILINLLVNVIKLYGFPSTVDTRNIVLYGLLFGSYGIKEIDGNFTALYCSPVGVPNNDGDFINVKMGSIYTPLVIDGVNGVNCVVGYNNSLRTADYNIQRYADLFTQLDVSLKANIKYARLNKIFGVSDERTRTIIETALKNADNGQNAIITDTNMMKALLTDGGIEKPVYSIDLTEVKDVDKIQYISNAHLDLLKRFMWLYGLSMNLSPKMAQQSTEEIANADSGTTILVDDMLGNYQKFCDACNKMYGWKTYAELGNAWENKQKSLNMTSDKDGDAYDENIDGDEPKDEPKDERTGEDEK